MAVSISASVGLGFAASTAEGVDICIEALKAAGETVPMQVLSLRAKLAAAPAARGGPAPDRARPLRHQ